MKLRLLLFNIFFIFLISCDDENKIPISDLLGTWEANNGSITECNDFNDNRPGINYIPCQDSPCLEMVFYEGGEMDFNTHPSNSSYQEIAANYTVSGSKLTVCFVGNPECLVYKVVIEEDEMTLTRTSEDSGCVRVTILSKII